MSHHSEMNTHVCLFNQELLVDYVSGNCAPDERLAAERHLAQCAECRREVLELEKTWWALDVWQEEKTPGAPRLNDLRLRLAAQTDRRGLWPMIQDAVGCRLALLRFRLSSLHFSPATSIASLVFGILAAALGLTLTQLQQPGFIIAPAMASGPAATVPASKSLPAEAGSTFLARSLDERLGLDRVPTADSRKRYLNEKIRMGYDGQLIPVTAMNYGHAPSREIPAAYQPEFPIRPAAARPYVIYMSDTGMVASR
ncbi:MAG: zf-HC2 domain-containing protein [bacterium]